jgi:magnesium chelatase accessory protein
MRRLRVVPPSAYLSLERDGTDWPHRASSRFVEAAGIRWHVQIVGEGPVLLLLHGTGASTHSWRDLVPLLAPSFKLVAPDLPGHAFTQTPPSRMLSLPGMASGVGALLRMLDLRPALAAGHSAGAAVVLQMAHDGALEAAHGFISLNGALLPYGGSAARMLSPLAKLLFANSLLPKLFAWKAGDTRSVTRLIRNTGSTIDERGIEFYRRLVGSPSHVAAALGMMANWDLQAFNRNLPALAKPLLLVAGQNDRAILARDAFIIRDRVKGARVEILTGLGHLAHEERPEQVAALIRAFALELGVLS